jgi:hypothetical protein
MPPRQHNSLIAKRVKARIAIRRARDASPAEIAQYALSAAQQWRLRDGLVSFLTAPERQAFERFEQYHHERSAAPTAAFPLPSLEVRPAEQRPEDVYQANLTRARAEGLDAVIRRIVTQPRLIAESMPLYALYPSEKRAIRDFSDRLHREGLMAPAVCEKLVCSRVELDRWSADERLPYAGWRHVYFYRSGWERVWFWDVVERAKPRIARWRNEDAREHAWRREPTKKPRSMRQDR